MLIWSLPERMFGWAFLLNGISAFDPNVRGALSVMGIVIGNGIGNPSSKPG